MSSKNLVDLRGRNTRFRAERSTSFFSQPERPSPLRERRRRARIVALVLVAIASAVIVYELHALSYSPRFSFQHVIVMGAQFVPPDEVEALVRARLAESQRGFISGSTIFNYPKDDISAAIVNEFPRVSNVRLFKHSILSNEIVVELRERLPFARWCSENESALCYQMDDTGYIFDSEDILVPFITPYTFLGGLEASSTPIGGTVAPGHMRGITALADVLGRSQYRPTRIVIAKESDFSIETQDGLLLKFTYGSLPETLVRNLDLVFSSDALRGKEAQVEYVDLRFGNRVYYRLKGQEERQSAPR